MANSRDHYNCMTACYGKAQINEINRSWKKVVEVHRRVGLIKICQKDFDVLKSLWGCPCNLLEGGKSSSRHQEWLMHDASRIEHVPVKFRSDAEFFLSTGDSWFVVWGDNMTATSLGMILRFSRQVASFMLNHAIPLQPKCPEADLAISTRRILMSLRNPLAFINNTMLFISWITTPLRTLHPTTWQTFNTLVIRI